MSFPNGETVVRKRRALVVDPYSQETTLGSWATATTTNILGCAVSQGSTSEPLQDGRAQVVSDFTVFMPAGTDVTAQDRLTIRGVECQVDGHPFDWRSPFTGWAPGLAVNATRVEG